MTNTQLLICPGLHCYVTFIHHKGNTKKEDRKVISGWGAELLCTHGVMYPLHTELLPILAT